MDRMGKSTRYNKYIHDQITFANKLAGKRMNGFFMGALLMNLCPIFCIANNV